MSNIIYYLNKAEENEVSQGNFTIFNRYIKKTLNKIDSKNGDERVETLVLYSEKNLYVLVVSNQEKVIDNDRAYQNGDGFHFVIAKPKENNSLTDEFYVLGVSPLSNTKRRVFEWYKNVEFTGRQIINGDIKHKYMNGDMYFLATVSWEELNPYRPYIYEELGFNISYVRDINGEKKIFILEEDDYIQCENNLRNYKVFKFENLTSNDTSTILIDLDKINCKTDEDVMLRLGVNSIKESVATIELKINDKKSITKSERVTKGLNLIKIRLDKDNLREGNNSIEAKVNLDECTVKKDFELYVYNKEEFSILEDEIDTFNKVGNKFLEESTNSLRFYCKDFSNRLSQLKEYESFENLDKYIKDIEYKFNLVKHGEDLFKRGQVLRLGLKSDIDGSIEPYSLYIPKSVENNNFKGLMVCLHGSGSDDRHTFNIFYERLAEKSGLVMVAPFARGTSHAYCTTEALSEIIELTQKIKAMFGLEDKKTILQGFSMGGYGVLRTFDYCNKEFDALAIFSGHHDIPGMFGIENEPNYLEDENISKFKHKDMIIYHGSKDGNCDFNDVKEFLDKIKLVNNKAEVVVSECGHEGLREEWYESFKEWVNKVLK
jgi:predicted esterase